MRLIEFQRNARCVGGFATSRAAERTIGGEIDGAMVARDLFDLPVERWIGRTAVAIDQPLVVPQD